MIDSAWPETKPCDHLRNLLDRAWILHVERNAHQHEKNQQQAEHQDLHGKGLGDGGLWIVRLHMQSVQNLGRQIPKVLVQCTSDGVLFMHTVDRASCGPAAE